MRRLYNCLFWVYFVVSSPYYFFRVWGRGDWSRSFGQRFGHYDISVKQSITNRHMIWLQLLRADKLEGCERLLEALAIRLPNVKFIVSTSTFEVMQLIQHRLPAGVGKIYHPIDRRDCVARALGTMHPRAVILAGAELRPNFIWRARGRSPLFLVDAHLPNRSYARYRRLGFLFRPLLESLVFIGARTEDQAARFRRAGAPSEVVESVGDLAVEPGAVDKTVDAILAHLAGTDLYIAPGPPSVAHHQTAKLSKPT
jgi:3-deoxy-D-manno-octulosonic-acid transferase